MTSYALSLPFPTEPLCRFGQVYKITGPQRWCSAVPKHRQPSKEAADV